MLCSVVNRLVERSSPLDFRYEAHPIGLGGPIFLFPEATLIDGGSQRGRAGDGSCEQELGYESLIMHMRVQRR